MKLGAASVGLVAPLFDPEAIANGDYEQIAKNAEKCMGNVRPVGPPPEKLRLARARVRAMVRLDETAFLAKLGDLYERTRNKGTVYLSMKRFQGRLAAVRRRNKQRQAEAAEGQEPQCIVRASTNDKKTKISTLITAANTVQFQLALGNILRLNMDGLKRPKKKDKGDKKDGAEKKKEAKVPVKKDMASPKKEAAKAAADPAAKQKGKKK